MGLDEERAGGAGAPPADAGGARAEPAGERPAGGGEARYAASAGRVKLFTELEEVEARRAEGRQSELLPPFWRRLPVVITTTLQALVNWGRQNSLWYYPVGTACCAIDGLMHFGGTRFDADRHGMVPWFSPRQSDVMIVAGTITEKMAPAIRVIYDQMAEPRWVVAIGGCAINGGPFYQGYNVVDGVDKIIPVDVYVPGCPPRPEAVLHGIYLLREKIARAGRRGGVEVAGQGPQAGPAPAAHAPAEVSGA